MKVIVGMSGGVDSTVTAYLLKKEGYEVIGCHFDFADTVDKETSFNDAKKMCELLDIELIHKDYIEEFKNLVISSFVKDYEMGITPNPCAFCNGSMKFKKLIELKEELGADKIATGHYANVGHRNVSGEDRYFIKKSENVNKDQSYMLYRLSKEQLQSVIFPIGNKNKNDVRSIAKELGLYVADKKDSQDVCFIKNMDYVEYIKRYEFGEDYKEKIASGKLKEEDIRNNKYYKKGEFVDIDGKVLGYHDGIINYTIGQRKGLNIAFGERKFVKKIDIEKNQVMLCSNDELFSDEFSVYDPVFSGTTLSELLNSNKKYTAKLRYRHDGTMCHLVSKEDIEGGILKFKLSSKVRAITRGQSAVFYDGDEIMFGGRIL